MTSDKGPMQFAHFRWKLYSCAVGPYVTTATSLSGEHSAVHWRVFVSAKKKGTYYEIEQALQEALDEVRHRIDNRVQIF
jgi:hypothetical protein